MSKNRKKLIIESFQKMDSDMLYILLDDNKTYQDARKEVFLEKVNDAFSKLKKYGDTFLSSHIGFCNFKLCSNKGCKGYSFVGNKSKKHIDLIFKELNDEINDIFHCNGFQTNDKSIETESLIEIDIKNDKKANFKPSIDFSIKSQECKLAYEELIQYQNRIIDKTIYLSWLEKYFELNKYFHGKGSFSDNYSDFHRFYWLYFRINELNDFLQSNEFAKEAVEEFQTIDKSNEPQLLKWLIKYEKTGNDLTLFLYEDIDFESPEKSKYFGIDDFKINTSDFWYIAKFKFLFDEYYWEILEKYSTFSNEEKTRYINENNVMSEHVTSLTYHIDKRGIKL